MRDLWKLRGRAEHAACGGGPFTLCRFPLLCEAHTNSCLMPQRNLSFAAGGAMCFQVLHVLLLLVLFRTTWIPRQQRPFLTVGETTVCTCRSDGVLLLYLEV